MESFLTVNNIMFVITISTVVFSIYLYFRNPQVNLDKTQALFTERLDNMRADLINLRDNHIHTIDTRIEILQKTIGDMNLNLSTKITELSVIVKERHL